MTGAAGRFQTRVMLRSGLMAAPFLALAVASPLLALCLGRLPVADLDRGCAALLGLSEEEIVEKLADADYQQICSLRVVRAAQKTTWKNYDAVYQMHVVARSVTLLTAS